MNTFGKGAGPHPRARISASGEPLLVPNTHAKLGSSRRLGKPRAGGGPGLLAQEQEEFSRADSLVCKGEVVVGGVRWMMPLCEVPNSLRSGGCPGMGMQGKGCPQAGGDDGAGWVSEALSWHLMVIPAPDARGVCSWSKDSSAGGDGPAGR